jgi:hypothetical protein
MRKIMKLAEEGSHVAKKPHVTIYEAVVIMQMSVMLTYQYSEPAPTLVSCE